MRRKHWADSEATGWRSVSLPFYESDIHKVTHGCVVSHFQQVAE